MQHNFEKYGIPITAGAVANIGGVVASLGPSYFAYRRQSKEQTSYRDLF